MPRFFFDFFDGNTWCEDDDGLELASLEEACMAAFDGARSMWAELLEERRDPLLCAFAIKGSEQQTLMRLGFPELLDSCRGGARIPPSAELLRALHDNERRARTALKELRGSFAVAYQSLHEARTLLARIERFERPGSASRPNPDYGQTRS